MLNRAHSTARIAPGIAALAAITLLIGGAFAGLLLEGARDWAGAAAAFDGYMLRVARFTLLQAVLSTLFAVTPAILVARALSRHPSFPGRGLILKLFAVPLALPAIVAAMGVLALLGRAGYLAPVFSAATGSTWPGIYGLSGILVAHVFFNLPLATRLLVEALDTVPADQWRLASQLGMDARASFRLIEWPVLRAALPGVAGLVFMLCITSFTIVLTLGGGPAASTLEVAIYQALRFDFDPARAVTLTLAQIAMTLAVVAVLMRLGANVTGDANLAVARRSFVTVKTPERVFNTVAILLALVFVAGPMAAIVASGLEADLGRLLAEPAFHRAALTSVVLALLSASLAASMAWALAASRRAAAGGRLPLLERLFDTGASFVLVVPPIVIGAGWFILIRHVADVFAIAPVMVVAVNAVMAMPFALRAVRPAHDAAAGRHERLCASLGISGWNRLRLIDWPVLRRPLATALAFAMALSLGDLGVIALFGSDAVKTLPYLLFERMGSYRTADAAGLALLLGALCLALILAADWLGRREER
ncbi:thiamine/thiamine pyrophosphate ABC transporter permease [Arvimicrobium flavum]|uniref:thiamine/thiamine pyrophosphate ABC transporter permease n=1 Tax=Arvimicrobium flavum TaxID=3393320 RepID=UPI00237AE0F4|nr:thiamine/thiamine pyrophosphate ABC transporter permease [Mesorhizobium shangrilense]